MYLKRWLFTAFMVSVFAQTAYAASLQDTLHSFKAPLTLMNAHISNDQIEIDLVDAEHRQLKFTIGGRPPSTLFEMFDTTPRNEIVLRPQSAAFDGVTLPMGSSDEKQVLQLLEDWRNSGRAMVSMKKGKQIPVAAGIAENRRKLIERVIEILRARNTQSKVEHHVKQ